MSDGNDVVYWWDGAHWTHGSAPVPDCPGPPKPGGVVFCGPNAFWISEAGTEGQVLVSHGEDAPTWENITNSNPPWVTPTLTNNWKNYSTTFESAGYREIPGKIEFSGLVKGGATGKPIFTMALSRPLSKDSIHLGVAGKGVARIDVTVSGEVLVRTYQGLGSNVFVSLEDISVRH